MSDAYYVVVGGRVPPSAGLLSLSRLYRMIVLAQHCCYWWCCCVQLVGLPLSVVCVWVVVSMFARGSRGRRHDDGALVDGDGVGQSTAWL